MGRSRERLISTLGQKPTCAVQPGMSALLPIATLIAFFSMSALGRKRTFNLLVRAKSCRAFNAKPQPNYSGARALRNGMLEICIIPENG